MIRPRTEERPRARPKLVSTTEPQDIPDGDSTPVRLKSFVERIERLDGAVIAKQIEQRRLVEDFAIANRAHSYARDRMGRIVANPLLRFMDFVDPDIDTGCWVWRGSGQPDGYGLFSAGGKYQSAHRWSFMALRGNIPPGLYLDHLCRNRRCVNPWHLEPVTPAENVRRGISPAITSARQRGKTHCPHGHPYSGENLYIQPSNGARICRTCAAVRRTIYANVRRVK